MSKVSMMGHSSLLFVTLTMTLSSLGSHVQTSHSLDNTNSVRTTQNTGRNASDSFFSEVIFHSESGSDSSEGSGQSVDSTTSQKLINQAVIANQPEQASSESGSGITLTERPARPLHQSEAHYRAADRGNTSVTGHSHSKVHIISKESLSRTATAEQFQHSHTSRERDEDDLESPKRPAQTVVIPNFNGTNLLWDDMRRTLTFAWELHVFGSATLFLLMAVLALIGMVGACTVPHPICEALILANSLLALSGTLRGGLLLLDPYGTRQILSRATLAALHNIPLQFLLWAQVGLVSVTLRGPNLLLFPLKLQRRWVVGVLAVSHCTSLFVADLFSPTLSPSIPLLLQTLSLCWGLPLCMEILPKSFSHLRPFLKSSVPQCVPSQRIQKCAKQVIAVCAFLGVLCCSLQMYSLLWIYGLLGNWKRFSWGWWLSQFWARILELAWGFLLLVLGSWIFWMPSRGHSKCDQCRSRNEVSNQVGDTSLWGSIVGKIRKGPLRKSDQTWEDLMPSNWAKYNLSRAGYSNSIMCPYDDKPPSIGPEHKPDPVSNSSSESQAALLWQKVGERECILSLIEFDMRPPSPINLRRSIDDALYHGQLEAGGGSLTTFPPAYGDYGWTLDTESISASLDHFQAQEPTQLLSANIDYNGGDASPAIACQAETFNSVFSTVMHQHDWSYDDVTDL